MTHATTRALVGSLVVAFGLATAGSDALAQSTGTRAPTKKAGAAKAGAKGLAKSAKGMNSKRVVQADPATPELEPMPLPATPGASTTPVAATIEPATASGPAERTSGMTAQQIKDFITQKMEYDEHYFGTVLQARQRGKTLPGLDKQAFAAEVQRASLNLPVLERFSKEREAFRQGRAFTIPANPERYRVYANLILLMNMVQALEKGDYKAVAENGKKVVIRDKENLGLVRGERADYYVQLFREYFYLMGVATFRLGNDKGAVDWFARLEADADLMALKQAIAAEPQQEVDSVSVRLEEARKRAVAILPLTTLANDAATAWVGTGVREVLASDLAQYTTLLMVEQAQMEKVLNEIALGQSGVIDEKLAVKAGSLANAGSLVVGTYGATDGNIAITLSLLDAKDAKVLGEGKHSGRLEDVAMVARVAAMKLLTAVGWIDEAGLAEWKNARTPKGDTIKALVEARLLLATKADVARDLYAKAMEDDPSYARLFQDLQAQFSDITATVGVMPFVNASGNPNDAWMVTGVAEALASDLPKINFNVVERTQIAALLEQTATAQLLGDDDARLAGEKLNADFLVLGSILHVKPQIRIDLRFVEVRTGIVAFSTSAEDRTDDFMAALTSLSTEIVRRFNRDVPPEVLAQLAGKKMSKEDFEKYVREKLAKEAIDKSLAKKDPNRPLTPKEQQIRWSKWIAAGAGVGLVASGALLWRGSTLYGSAREALALRNEATSPALVDHYQGEAESLAKSGNLNVGLGAGIGLAALAAAGYAFYDLWFNEEPGAQSAAPVAP